MANFGDDLTLWAPGDVLTVAHLNELILKLKTFLNPPNPTMGGDNVAAASLQLSKLATPRCVFPIRFRITQPGQNLPAGGAIGGAAWLIGQYQGYTEDLARAVAPYPLRIFRVESYVASGAVSGSSQLFVNGVAQAATTLLNSHGAPASADVAIDVPDGQAITVRMTALADFAHLPVDYTVWCRAYLQAAP